MLSCILLEHLLLHKLASNPDIVVLVISRSACTIIDYACVRDIQQMQFLFFIFDTTGIFISIVRVKTSGRTSLSMLVLLTYTTRKLQYNVDHSFLKRSHQS
jgi:hypothetical protein